MDDDHYDAIPVAEPTEWGRLSGLAILAGTLLGGLALASLSSRRSAAGRPR